MDRCIAGHSITIVWLSLGYYQQHRHSMTQQVQIQGVRCTIIVQCYWYTVYTHTRASPLIH